jgi:hypothetical protein
LCGPIVLTEWIIAFSNETCSRLVMTGAETTAPKLIPPPKRSNHLCAMNKRVLYGSFVIVLVLAAPLAGRVVGTAWGAISAYQKAMAMFHNRRIALDITGQVINAAYRTYVYGR